MKFHIVWRKFIRLILISLLLSFLTQECALACSNKIYSLRTIAYEERAIKTGFELDPQRNLDEIIASNREYLQSKGLWIEELNTLEYDTVFILEDTELRPTLERLINLQQGINERRAVAGSIAKILKEYELGELNQLGLATMGMAVASGEAEPRRVASTIEQMLQLDGHTVNIQIPPKTEAIHFIQQNMICLAHFMQGVYLYSIGDAAGGQKAFERAQLTKNSDGPTGIFATNAISDTLFMFTSQQYFSGDIPLHRRYFMFNLARRLYNAGIPHLRSPADYASDIVLLQGWLEGANPLDMIETLLTIGHGEFSEFARERAAIDDEMGRGLRHHYEQTKRETMIASSYNTSPGVAVILGAGSFVVLPLVEMLRETLPDGKTLKYKEIILIELGVDLSKNALQKLVNDGTISEQEVQRVRVVKADATMILTRLTSRINEIVQQRLSSDNPREAPSEEIATLFQEISDPAQLVKYAVPVEERIFKDNSINIVVFAMAIQDFAGPILEYVETHSKIFRSDKALNKALNQWDSKAVQEGITAIILQDLARILTPNGIVFLGDVVGIKKPASEKDPEGKIKHFYDRRGLAGFVPPNLPFQVVHQSQWPRPLNEEGAKAHFVVESLVLKKVPAHKFQSDRDIETTIQTAI